MSTLPAPLARYELEALARRFLDQEVPCRQQVRNASDALQRVLTVEGFEVGLRTDQVFVSTDTGFALRTVLDVRDPVGSAAAVALHIELGLERKGSLQDSVVLRLRVLGAGTSSGPADCLHHVDLVASQPLEGWDERRDCIAPLTQALQQALARYEVLLDDDTVRRYALLLTQVLQP